MARVLPLAAP
jgi:multidrug transporter EmrE-like cation transporter